MNTYRLTLTLRGPLGTPLSADTLWGHVCWGLCYHEGPAAVEEFIARSADPPSDGPPLVISDPLPAGHLPRPCLPPMTPQARRALQQEMDARRNSSDETGWHDKLKKAGKRPCLPLQVFAGLIDDLSQEKWTRAALQLNGDGGLPKLVTVPVAHNAINRLTNHTLAEGGLFFQEEIFPAKPVDYDLWIRSGLSAERVRELIAWGLEGGYGRDAGTGKGHIEVGGIETRDLPAAGSPNALMTLGPCAPAAGDPTRGFWSTTTRFGKLGGPWASMAGDDQPGGAFKHPVIFLATGAVLAGPPRPYLGRIVRGVHPSRGEVVQYGLALTVRVRCPELQEVR